MSCMPRSQAHRPRLVRLAGHEHLVGHALLDDLAVQVELLQQLVVGALCGDRCRPRAPRSRRPARSSTAGGRSRTSCGPAITSRSASLISCSVEASTDEVASSRIRIRGSASDRARDRDPLALAAGQRQPALADQRVVALGQAADEVVGLGRPGGVLDLLAGGVGAARRRCCRGRSPRTGTGRRVTIAIWLAQADEVDRAHVGAVDVHGAVGRRRTAAAAATRARSCPSPSRRRAPRSGPASTSRSMSAAAPDAARPRTSGRLRAADTWPRPAGSARRGLGAGDLRLAVEHLEDPRARGGRALRGARACSRACASARSASAGRRRRP